MANRLLDPVANPEDRVLIGQYLEQSEKDVKFLNANWLDWVATYPDKWVAVYEEELVGVGDTIEEVVREACTKGAPESRVVIEYLDKEPRIMILAGAAC